MCCGKVLQLQSCLLRVISDSCVWMAISFPRLGEISVTISLKRLLKNSFSFYFNSFFNSLDSQVKFALSFLFFWVNILMFWCLICSLTLDQLILRDCYFLFSHHFALFFHIPCHSALEFFTSLALGIFSFHFEGIIEQVSLGGLVPCTTHTQTRIQFIKAITPN